MMFVVNLISALAAAGVMAWAGAPPWAFALGWFVVVLVHAGMSGDRR